MVTWAEALIGSDHAGLGYKMQKYKLWFNKHYQIIAVFFIIIAALPIYLQSIQTPFFYDDIRIIQRNLEYMPTLYFNRAFFYPFPSRPPLNLLIYLLSSLNLKSPVYFHLFSMSIHILNSILLYALLNKYKTLFNNNIAFYISLLFLIHPLAGASVHYIHSVSILFSAFFILITTLLFSDYFLEKDKKRYCYLFLSYISALFAYISKESSIILPLLLVLVLVYLLKIKPGIKHIPIFTIYFIESLVIFYLLIVKGNAHKGAAGFSLASPFAFMFTQLHYGLNTVSLYFLPFKQSIYHYLTMQNYQLSFSFLFSVLLVIMIIILLFRNKTHLLIKFSTLWIGIVLLPTNTIYPLNDILAEYRLYLTLIGFCILITQLVYQLNLSKNIKYIIFISIFLYFYIFSYGRAFLWRDTSSIWLDALEKYPSSTRILNNVGTSYLRKGKLGKAKHYLKMSIKNNPYEYFPYHNLGVVFYNEKNYMAAINYLLKVTNLFPEYPYSYYYLGLCYEKLGDEIKKEESFQKAGELSLSFRTEMPIS